MEKESNTLKNIHERNMIMTNELNMLFSNTEFVEKNKDLKTREEILAAVAEQIPTVTMADLDAYFDTVNSVMDVTEGELKEEALDQVSGGVVDKVLAIITFCYGAGYAIGRAIKNWKKGK